MRALAREVGAGLTFAAIGVAVSLAVVLVHDAEASDDQPRISWVWRGMSPFAGQQCSDYEHDPDWDQYHIAGWQSCWHLTEWGYPAIDYTRTQGQTAGSGVWLDYEGDFELFKMEEYADTCTGVRAKIYWGSYAEENYRGDIHYLHIDPNELWIGEEVPYQVIYIGDVLSEENQGCLWTGPHLHQSARSSASPFCSNKFEDPSEGDNWQHKVHWLPDYTDDTDCDGWKDDEEDYIGTDALDDCTDQPGDADAWPPDINMDTSVNVLDMFAFVNAEVMGCAVGDPCYDPRFDLIPDGYVSTLDLFIYVQRHLLGMECRP